MSDNKKAASGATGTASKTANDKGDFTPSIDPLKGWYSLAAGVKPSRQRKQKRGWPAPGFVTNKEGGGNVE